MQSGGLVQASTTTLALHAILWAKTQANASHHPQAGSPHRKYTQYATPTYLIYRRPYLKAQRTRCSPAAVTSKRFADCRSSKILANQHLATGYLVA